MSIHFDEGTTVSGFPVANIISDLEKVRNFSGAARPDLLISLGLAHKDPCDPLLLMITDLGNVVRSASIGERVPLRDAERVFTSFMNDRVLPAASASDEVGEICEVWIYGSLMRGEPTVGDADIFVRGSDAVTGALSSAPHDFISVADNDDDLLHMPIPCRKISVSRGTEGVTWGFADDGPRPYPGNLCLDDAPEISSFETDQGAYRSSTTPEHVLLETFMAACEAAAENGGTVPAPLAGTLARDMRSRYEGGANADEDLSRLWPEVSSWGRPVTCDPPLPEMDDAPALIS